MRDTPRRRGGPAWADRFFERFYPIPDPCDTLSSWEHWTNRDLRALSLSELLAERERLKLRILYDPRPAPWLLERLEMLQQAIRNAA